MVNLEMNYGKEDEENQRSSEVDTDYGLSSKTNCDQDSDISFMNDTDEEIDTAELKRSTEEAMEWMRIAKIRCWIKTHRRMKCRLAMRIASLPDESWEVKAAGWNPGTKPTELREDQKEDGKMKQKNSSSLKKLKRRQEVS